jgi:hypothetical protein
MKTVDRIILLCGPIKDLTKVLCGRQSTVSRDGGRSRPAGGHNFVMQYGALCGVLREGCEHDGAALCLGTARMLDLYFAELACRALGGVGVVLTPPSILHS